MKLNGCARPLKARNQLIIMYSMYRIHYKMACYEQNRKAAYVFIRTTRIIIWVYKIQDVPVNIKNFFFFGIERSET